MERIDGQRQPVTRLSAWFRHSETSAPVAVVETQVDPGELLAIERNEVLASARAEGFAEGMRAAEEAIGEATEKARRECEAKHSQALQALETSHARLTELLRRVPGMVDAVEELAIESSATLAYEALLRMLGETPGRERIVAICRDALRGQQRRPVVVRLSQADAIAVGDLLDSPGVRVEADPRLKDGQCQLDTGLGSIDTGLDVRLDLMHQAFLRAAASHGGAP